MIRKFRKDTNLNEIFLSRVFSFTAPVMILGIISDEREIMQRHQFGEAQELTPTNQIHGGIMKFFIAIGKKL